MNSRLEIILGARKGEASPELRKVTKACTPPTVAELSAIKRELQELLPSVRGVQTLEVDERKAQGRLVRIDPAAQAIYVHPDIFKRGVEEGTATLQSALFASAFAATLVGTLGQSVWATYHCLSWLIVQTSKEPALHIGHLARSYASLESLGWDVREPAAYWHETHRELRREHCYGGSVGAPQGDLLFFSPHAEKSIAKQMKGMQFSDAIMEKLRSVSGATDAEITKLLINYNIYSSRENPSFSRGFLIRGDQYISSLFRRWDQDARELHDLASEMLAEGESSVVRPMRAYVSKFSGESECILDAVDKANGVWPTKREENELAQHPLGRSIDPDIRGLIHGVGGFTCVSSGPRACRARRLRAEPQKRPLQYVQANGPPGQGVPRDPSGGSAPRERRLRLSCLLS